MPEIVDSRDVLDPNAKTRCAFRGAILGRFRRMGPDRWDPYTFVREPGGEIEVLPGIRVQVEKHGAIFRMRRQGSVIRVRWVPEEPVDPDTRRSRFLQQCVYGFHNAPGHGVSAFIQRSLKR